jgi:hypothetical protein
LVKFFITGRPEPRIRSGFRLPLLRPHTEVFLLHEVDRATVDQDMERYLNHRLSELAASRSDIDMTTPWPSPEDVATLAQKSSGLFIFASTAVKVISSPYHDPREQLQLVISLMYTSLHEGRAGIDRLYAQILEHAFTGVDEDEAVVFIQFRSIVGSILLLLNPLPQPHLAALLNINPGQITRSLHSLHSVLMIPQSDTLPIRSFHASFFDYLTDPTRCTNIRFLIQPSIAHTDITIHCLQLMKARLKSNIYSAKRYQMNRNVKDLPSCRKENVGETLEYACQFFASHLGNTPQVGDHIEIIVALLKGFAENLMLAWVEVLSFAENLGSAVYALRDVHKWVVEASLFMRILGPKT